MTWFGSLIQVGLEANCVSLSGAGIVGMCHRTPHHFSWLFVGITNFDLRVMMVFTKLTNYGVTSDPFVIKKLMVGNFL